MAVCEMAWLSVRWVFMYMTAWPSMLCVNNGLSVCEIIMCKMYKCPRFAELCIVYAKPF